MKFTTTLLIVFLAIACQAQDARIDIDTIQTKYGNLILNQKSAGFVKWEYRPDYTKKKRQNLVRVIVQRAPDGQFSFWLFYRNGKYGEGVDRRYRTLEEAIEGLKKFMQ